MLTFVVKMLIETRSPEVPLLITTSFTAIHMEFHYVGVTSMASKYLLCTCWSLGTRSWHVTVFLSLSSDTYQDDTLTSRSYKYCASCDEECIGCTGPVSHAHTRNTTSILLFTSPLLAHHRDLSCVRSVAISRSTLAMEVGSVSPAVQ